MASTIGAALKAAAGKRETAAAVVEPLPTAARVPAPKSAGTVLIGAHFSPEVRRALMLVQVQPENAGRNLRDLLGEAINDLCAKYGQPQPYKDVER